MKDKALLNIGVFCFKKKNEAHMNWHKRALELWIDGKSYNQIAAELNLTYNQVRSFIRRTDEYEIAHPKVNAVGIIGDAHCPFNHPNYLQFCVDTFKKHHVKQVVCIGDLVDNHAISRHPTEPNAYGAYAELDKALIEVAKFTKAFPKVRMCQGNHDGIPMRQAATLGIGDRYLKTYHQLWNLPKTWEIEDEFIIDGVLYKHGINCGGKDGALNTAVQEQMSTVIGHMHSFGGCKYAANKRELIFGLNVGCGIDIDAYAFAYGKHSKYRPTLGCGIVYNKSEAYFIPMGAEYFRN